MTRSTGIRWFLLAASMSMGLHQPVRAFSLTVHVEKMEQLTGVLYLSLFNSADGFPGNYRTAFRTANREVSETVAVFIFDEIPAGEYAVSILHDENRNGKMDFSLIGAPTEGYGASNDAHRWFGPPRWEDARFTLDSDLSLTIHLR